MSIEVCDMARKPDCRRLDSRSGSIPLPYNLSSKANYVKGYLQKSWELTDPSTYVCHLGRESTAKHTAGNGRELVASDVVFSFDRLYGLGVMTPSPYQAQ